MHNNIDQDDLKTVSEFLAPFYNETPQETAIHIVGCSYSLKNTDTYLETRGFCLWRFKDKLHVNIANHFLNANPKMQALKVLFDK